MIIAQRKSIKEILEMLEGYKKILILGCRACVTVCCAGGQKEVEVMGSIIRIDRKKRNKAVETIERVIDRQCDAIYFSMVDNLIQESEVVLSLACGVGVNMLAETYPKKLILPALNTGFMGITEEQGVWSERCIGCGDCILDKTAGLCPLARCPKGVLNGPCLGSNQGKCEVYPENDCVWYLIYKRLKELNQLDKLKEIIPPKNWSEGLPPRKIIREDIRL